MSDSYQAVYDAVRSRLGNISTDAIYNAVRDADIGHHFNMAAQQSSQDMTTPHVLMRPSLRIDGNKWMAHYGEDLQNGVAGFGDSPSEAMADFDREWWKKLPVSQKYP